MGRLIDVDELFPNGVFYVNDNNPMRSLDELINRISNAPTAYDVEAVVRELEEKSNGFFVNDEELGEMFVKTIPLPLAIEIVKRGGRNETD